MAWNLLPDTVRDPTRLFDSFRRDLKTFLSASTLEALQLCAVKIHIDIDVSAVSRIDILHLIQTFQMQLRTSVFTLLPGHVACLTVDFVLIVNVTVLFVLRSNVYCHLEILFCVFLSIFL